MSPFQEDYFSRVNDDLLSLIPMNARTVLEVGCGSGAMGALYKSHHPEARYFGVELDPLAARRARHYLDVVLCADVESNDLHLDVFPEMDCIIYGDVLEHLRDPWAILRQHAGLLRAQGLVLACIPNVQHWSVLLTLLRGDWPVTNEGLFDRSHLRWFTRSGIEALFNDAGLRLLRMQSRVVNPEGAKAFVEAIQQGLPTFGLDSQNVLEGVMPFQYIVVAQKRS